MPQMDSHLALEVVTVARFVSRSRFSDLSLHVTTTLAQPSTNPSRFGVDRARGIAVETSCPVFPDPVLRLDSTEAIYTSGVTAA